MVAFIAKSEPAATKLVFSSASHLFVGCITYLSMNLDLIRQTFDSFTFIYFITFSNLGVIWCRVFGRPLIYMTLFYLISHFYHSALCCSFKLRSDNHIDNQFLQSSYFQLLLPIYVISVSYTFQDERSKKTVNNK